LNYVFQILKFKSRVENLFPRVGIRDGAAHIMRIAMKGDYCTREGAERLKEQIEAYWAERMCV